MSGLAPNLFQRRFQDFMQIGRARLPSLSPEWTDHNAHDPGITLMELLAWVSEAQLYSLSRMRRDERAAYASLFGIAPTGTQGARGLIWPDSRDSKAPALSFENPVIIPDDAVVRVTDTETPTFRPTHRLLWLPVSVASVESRLANGQLLDHTFSNEHGGPAFLPFGERAGARDVLAIAFSARAPLVPDVGGALIAIGVRAVPADVGNTEVGSGAHSPLSVTLVTENARFPLRIASDTTNGLLSTGALLLDIAGVTGAPTQFTLELRCERGFARPPRLLRLAPNVVPILQGQVISDELTATGLPGWSFELAQPGLRFGAGQEPVTVQVAESAGQSSWQRCDRLGEHGPDERVYEFELKSGKLTFGNGINGRIPEAQAQVLARYAVSDADQGAVARNRAWKVAGFPGNFGVNLDPVSNGSGTPDWLDDRREARRRSKDEHALVSAEDIASAALELRLLEVARAWVLAPAESTPHTGVVTLVVMRARSPGSDDPIVETARWLEAIRRRLAPRMLLGTRLAVRAPRYVDFSVRASIEANPGLDPAQLQAGVSQALSQRLSLVASAQAPAPRGPGVPLSRRDLAAWLRASPGVRRVEVSLLDAQGRPVEIIDVPQDAFPRASGAFVIDVKRPTMGDRR